MVRELRPALIVFLLLTRAHRRALSGCWSRSSGRCSFRRRRSGSLIERDGKAVGLAAARPAVLEPASISGAAVGDRRRSPTTAPPRAARTRARRIRRWRRRCGSASPRCAPRIPAIRGRCRSIS